MTIHYSCRAAIAAYHLLEEDSFVHQGLCQHHGVVVVHVVISRPVYEEEHLVLEVPGHLGGVCGLVTLIVVARVHVRRSHVPFCVHRVWGNGDRVTRGNFKNFMGGRQVLFCGLPSSQPCPRSYWQI